VSDLFSPDNSSDEPKPPSVCPPDGEADLASRIRILEEALSDESAAAARPAVPVYPFWGWLDVLLFGLALLGCLFGAAIATVAVNFAIVAAGAPQYSLSLAQSAVVMQALGFGPALFLLSRMLRARYGRGLRDAVQLVPVERIGLYAGAGLATALMVAILSAVFKLQEMEMPMNEFIRTDADLILVGIAAFTFGPLFEEMMFRGFLQPLFTKSLGVVAGIFLSALLFALPHGPQYGWHWQLMLIITVAGSVFGYIRWKASSTTAATLAHAAYNGLLLMGAVVQRFQDGA
jgi:membrane protease YdiL (CAAX protease family)